MLAVLGAPSQGAAVNLLQNPGAEAGAGAAVDSAVVPVPGWTTTGSFTAVVYGIPGFPLASEGAPVGGANFFAGGPGASFSTATQVVDVSASAGQIDAGQLQTTLSGYLGGFQQQEDSAVVTATFQAADRHSLGSVSIGPVTATNRGGSTLLMPRSAGAAVPDLTRVIQVVITARRSSGVYNDGYADNLSLVLEPSTQPRKTTVYLWGARVSSVGDPGAVLSSQAITGSGASTVVTQGGATTRHTARGSFRVVWHYRRPAGKVRTLSLVVVGPASPVTARRGGGGALSLRVRVSHSDFSGCDTRDYGIVTLRDRAGAGRDTLVLSVCHSKTSYVDGGPHHTRVFTLIGRRR